MIWIVIGLRVFCSEVQVTQHKNGRPYIVWEKLAGVRNEPLDTSVYALAAANLVGVQRIRWSSEEKKLESQTVSYEEVDKAISKMLTDGGIAEYQIKSRKMRYHSLDELYRQRDRLRIRIARRKKRGGFGGRNVGVSFCDF